MSGWEGTGHVVYDGYLYYILYNTNTMVKYDIQNRNIVTTSPLPNAGYHNLYAYGWGGFSDIDFAADEQGLWVLYATSSNNGKMVISKLDPSNLSILKFPIKDEFIGSIYSKTIFLELNLPLTNLFSIVFIYGPVNELSSFNINNFASFGIFHSEIDK